MNRMYLFLTIFLAVCGDIYAQNNGAFRLQRINGDIELDGLSGESAWQNIAPLPLVMYQPTFQGVPTEKTEILVGYDDDYLYFAGRFYDSEPAGIRNNSMNRDAYNGDDAFNIILDSYNDNENALWFLVLPSGVRFDATIANDGEGQWSNNSWNTFWDTKAVINEDGWFAEVRIPFSSLQFQDDAGNVTMGLIAHRLISRKNERMIFPAIAPTLNNGQWKPSIAQDIELEGVFTKKPIYITPYGLGGMDHQKALNGDKTAFEGDEKFDGEAGLDIKYNVTSNLTLDLTVNTDFAQVEADNQQVNLTRFSLFFPEKRQFFQERSSIFDFNTGGNTRLFHSRRIGISSDQEVRILGGARIAGRVGDWDVGFLNMQTEKLLDTPSENFGVLRLRRQVLNQFSYLGAMTTNKLGTDGSYNTAVGLDGIVRVSGDEYFSYNWAHTFERGQTPNFFNRGKLKLIYERRKNVGFNYRNEINISGEYYDPEMGFVTRRDFTQLSNGLNYGWLGGEDSRFRVLRLNLSTNAFFRNNDDELETLFIGPNMNFQFKSGANIFVGGRIEHENLKSGFPISDEVKLPAGEYTYARFDLFFNPSQGQLFRPGANFTAGSYYDGNILNTAFHMNWNPSSKLSLNGNYSFNRISFADRGQKFTSHLSGMRLNYAYNIKVSANSFFQYNSVIDKIITNIRFRYNFSEGNDLFIVYNEILNSDRDPEGETFSPRLPLSENRTVIFKYSYTFIK